MEFNETHDGAMDVADFDDSFSSEVVNQTVVLMQSDMQSDGNDERSGIPKEILSKIEPVKPIQDAQLHLLQSLLANFSQMHAINTDTPLLADNLVNKHHQIMTSKEIKKSVDHYGRSVKEGEHTIVQCSPINDLRLMKNTISDKYVIVIGQKCEDQLYTGPGWIKVDGVSVFLKDATIGTEVVMVAAGMDVPVITSPPSSDDSINQAIVRNVPSNTYEFKCDTVIDVVSMFEQGDETYLPALEWTASKREDANWSGKMRQNFTNFVKYYLYIRDHYIDENITKFTKVKKTEWRAASGIKYNPSGALNKINFYDIAVKCVLDNDLINTSLN